MTYLNEKIVKLGLDPHGCVGGENVTIFDGCGVLVEGHRGVAEYSSERIVVRLKKRTLTVRGSKLCILEVNSTELFLSGKLSALEYGI